MKERHLPGGMVARYGQVRAAIVSHPESPQQFPPMYLCWSYKVHGHDEARLICPTGASRDEALELLERRWPNLVEYLQPAGAGS